MTIIFNLAFDNAYSRLPASFYTKMKPEGFSASPFLIHGNEEGARLIGLDPASFQDPDFVRYFAGTAELPGSDPLAMVYAGHQFGVWAGQLGDGRALLLGQIRDPKGALWDIELKGSGLTPYSRMGDGRAVLRSCIREYLCGEALQALGIPTTRSLCIIGTGQQVQRESPEPGAILTRLSPSHVRFGHFEHFYYSGQLDSLKQLADYVIREHFPHLISRTMKYQEWFSEVLQATARTVAQWQAVGFAHGVMNTDNMSILGLTIDYGPFGFMENYDPGFVCNHSDHGGRYAFDQQPLIALWNLYALAHALQPVLDLEASQEILKTYQEFFAETYDGLMAVKCGLQASSEVTKLWQDLLKLMHKHHTDYTQTFRKLSYTDTPEGRDAWLTLFGKSDEAREWLETYQRFSAEGGLQGRAREKVNPHIILRNWVAETAIRAAEDRQDYGILQDVLDHLRKPFQEHPVKSADFSSLPPQDMQRLSVSCSS